MSAPCQVENRHHVPGFREDCLLPTLLITKIPFVTSQFHYFIFLNDLSILWIKLIVQKRSDNVSHRGGQLQTYTQGSQIRELKYGWVCDCTVWKGEWWFVEGLCFQLAFERPPRKWICGEEKGMREEGVEPPEISKGDQPCSKYGKETFKLESSSRMGTLEHWLGK